MICVPWASGRKSYKETASSDKISKTAIKHAVFGIRIRMGFNHNVKMYG
jgi:hypothetical protein